MAKMFQVNAKDEAKAKKWSRLISIWYLLGSIIGCVFYVLIQLSIIKAESSLFEIIDFYVEFVLGLVIFYGLLNFKPWGWKLTVIAIPIKWLFSISYISQNYLQGVGIVYALFIVIDIIILYLLFMPGVKRLFAIHNWPSSKWIIIPLWLSGAFLAFNDIWGSLVAGIFSVSLLMGLIIITKSLDKKNYF